MLTSETFVILRKLSAVGQKGLNFLFVINRALRTLHSGTVKCCFAVAIIRVMTLSRRVLKTETLLRKIWSVVKYIPRLTKCFLQLIYSVIYYSFIQRGVIFCYKPKFIYKITTNPTQGTDAAISKTATHDRNRNVLQWRITSRLYVHLAYIVR